LNKAVAVRLARADFAPPSPEDIQRWARVSQNLRILERVVGRKRRHYGLKPSHGAPAQFVQASVGVA
jgi:hypothetical protein